MHRHIFLTGEIGCGKSTALRSVLDGLQGVKIKGLQTYYNEPRGSETKRLYLRAFGDTEQGTFLAELPGGDLSRITSVFNEEGSALLKSARDQADLIVIDEIGRLERDAAKYHAALASCLGGDVPVLAVVRKLKAGWADWIRGHENAVLIEVTQENRDGVPAMAAAILRESMANRTNRAK